MIINDNLLAGYNGVQKIIAQNKGVATDNYQFFSFQIPSDLIENRDYILSFQIKQFNGSGKSTLMISDKAIIKSAGSKKINVHEPVEFKFKYRKDITETILIYSDLSGKTRGVGADIKNIKIEEGNVVTLYIPNKNDVKPVNQAIFPIGGGTSKSSLYRGYKGVSLC